MGVSSMHLEPFYEIENAWARRPCHAGECALTVWQELCQTLSVVGDDQIGTGALDGQEGFEDGAVVIEPVVSCGGFDHRVFAADLVGDERDLNALAHLGDDVEIRPGGFRDLSLRPIPEP